jgi:hypothetical protein
LRLKSQQHDNKKDSANASVRYSCRLFCLLAFSFAAASASASAAAAHSVVLKVPAPALPLHLLCLPARPTPHPLPPHPTYASFNNPTALDSFITRLLRPLLVHLVLPLPLRSCAHTHAHTHTPPHALHFHSSASYVCVLCVVAALSCRRRTSIAVNQLKKAGGVGWVGGKRPSPPPPPPPQKNPKPPNPKPQPKKLRSSHIPTAPAPIFIPTKFTTPIANRRGQS